MKMETLDQLANKPYSFKFHYEEDDHCYFAEIEEIPGCWADGETIEEALANIKKSLKIWVKNAMELNISIPEPKTLSEKDFSGKLVLRLPKALHKKISVKAEENGVSLNQYLLYLIAEKSANEISKHKTVR